MNAFGLVRESFNTKWNDLVYQLLPFLPMLIFHAEALYCDAAAPSEIIKFFAGTSNCLLDYYLLILSSECSMALTTYTNLCAIQNSKAMYKTLKNSIYNEKKDNILPNWQLTTS